MVKSYLKYEHSKNFGIITSASSNVVWTRDSHPGKSSRNTRAGRAVVAANEEVLCWDLKKGELLSRWRDGDCKAEVTAITQSQADRDIVAVGYGDGSIRLWDSKISTVIVGFNGHRSAVTTLTFDGPGVRLASGSKDTDVIVWDLVGEVGLYRLRGHKDQITALQFLPSPDNQVIAGEEEMDAFREIRDSHPDDGGREGALLTTGKDALIKLWDLASQHCIETHVAQTNGECWAMGVSPDGNGCITGGNDGELRIWSIDLANLHRATNEATEMAERRFLHDRGVIHRQGKDKTLGINFHPSSDYIAVHGSEKAVEIWRVRSGEEVQKSIARKRKRRREKAAASAGKGGPDVTMAGEEERLDDALKVDISEVFVSYMVVRTGGKVRSIDWAAGEKEKRIQLLTATTNNQLEVYDIPTKARGRRIKSEEPPDYSRTFSIDMPGHRTDVRSLALSSDDRMLASASSGSLRIWNVRTQNCIRTFECGYALCCSFLPGDKIVVVGTKNGELELFDVASSAMVETVQAHDGPIWSLQVHPDGKSVVTGSADKSAKFWDFEVTHEEIPGTKRTSPRLRLVHSRTLKVADDILSVRFSPDSRLVAISLLDNTVKVFFVDSLKLFLNLYGHKLPVLNMDISSDSKLIVTCSADKNVRLWGLDFGDCHKAFFAHQDSIMQVAFVPHNHDGNGHHFFSASKDRVIKYWDGDKFEQIQKLEGHHGEVWALAVSRNGDFFVSASHDKSIRVWEQTDEQIFLEEEKERELEEIYENTLTTSMDRIDEDGDGGEKSEVAAATKQTIETLMAGERVIEALEMGMVDLALMSEWNKAKALQPNIAQPARNLVFLALGNISAETHVLNVIQKIKAAALQDALLVLPFDQVIALFTFLNIWASRQWNIPLTCRILFFMLKTHHRQIVGSKAIRPMLEGIRGNLRKALRTQKNEMGFNLAALRYVGDAVKDAAVSVYVDESWEDGKDKGIKKRGFMDIA
ncbi:hypothetical protein FGG08_001594 [Glutinoglossum americanum]|uniref:Small-subunit processome Utp12 domain-containing protein n=1 Tax=Glutinoglossum americanum TaxID=1670608 RepID=A0A9P8I6F8_9PEZI|nr:hypothetical protein FGG08_001594 [Glutinoglossum americanum]